jgi:hypothetical protein
MAENIVACWAKPAIGVRSWNTIDIASSPSATYSGTSNHVTFLGIAIGAGPLVFPYYIGDILAPFAVTDFTDSKRRKRAGAALADRGARGADHCDRYVGKSGACAIKKDVLQYFFVSGSKRRAHGSHPCGMKEM